MMLACVVEYILRNRNRGVGYQEQRKEGKDSLLRGIIVKSITFVTLSLAQETLNQSRQRGHYGYVEGGMTRL